MPQTLFSNQKVINVADYGATGNTADYTQQIQNAINAISSDYGGWAVTPSSQVGVISVSIPFKYVLYFPPGVYKINSPIIMDSMLYGINIIGDNALIVPTENGVFQDAQGNDVCAFQHTYCYDFYMEGMNFSGFNKAVGLYKDYRVNTGRLKITDCGFQGNEMSLELSFSSGLAIIERSKFLSSEIALNILSGDKVIVSECWIGNKAGGLSALASDGTTKIPHLAPIVNHSRLSLKNCILEPNHPGPDSIEPAWINNYASVTVEETRQGGEAGSFTLVNNFVGLGDLYSSPGPEPSSVVVKNSQCYAVYNNTEVAPADYWQPAILRYVSAIPNITDIGDNRGMLQAKIVGFSQYLYNEDSVAIQNMINASGGPGVVNVHNVNIKVENNVGGIPYEQTGSHIPEEMFPFVRDIAHLWPYKPTKGLSLLNRSKAPDGSLLFKFEYPEDLDAALMINYTSTVWTQGSSIYRGGFIGLLKSNGFCSNSQGSNLRFSLNLETLFNQIGDSEPGSWPGGNYTVECYWETTSTKFLDLNNNTNRNFIVKIIGSDGVSDSIEVAPVAGLLK